MAVVAVFSVIIINCFYSDLLLQETDRGTATHILNLIRDEELKTDQLKAAAIAAKASLVQADAVTSAEAASEMAFNREQVQEQEAEQEVEQEQGESSVRTR